MPTSHFDQWRELELDTTLDHFQFPTAGLESGVFNLGNVGSAGGQILYGSNERIGFRTGISGFDHLLIKPEGSPYFTTNLPYTRLLYVNGMKKEQFIDGLHTQNISRLWNASIRFKLYGADGFYGNQRTNNTNVRLGSRYSTRNNRYSIRLAGSYNKLAIDENGGLANDLSFINDSSGVTDILPVGLAGATNVVTDKVLQLHQTMNLGKEFFVNVEGDSLHQPLVKKGPKLFHSIHLSDRSYAFNHLQSDTSSYFEEIFVPIDSIDVFDSLRVQLIRNILGVAIPVGKRLQLAAWVENEFATPTQNSVRSRLENHIAGVEVIWHATPKLVVRVPIQYVAKGDFSGDIKLNPVVSFQPDSNSAFTLIGTHIVQHPEWVTQWYTNTHLKWVNAFDPTVTQNVHMNYKHKKVGWDIGAQATQIDNLIYWNEIARPQQATTTIHLFQAWLKQHFQIGNWHWRVQLYYQKSYGDPLIRLPEVFTFNRLYYQNHLFKGKMLAQVGVDVFYNSSYYANSYNPVTRQFFLQNETRIGNYPYVDAYFAFKVKSARVFLRTSHVQAGLMGNIYYMVPHYPMAGRNFRFGIDWTFFD